MQQLTRLYSVSRTERGACIHYKHDLGFKFIQFEIPDNSKKQVTCKVSTLHFSVVSNLCH